MKKLAMFGTLALTLLTFSATAQACPCGPAPSGGSDQTVARWIDCVIKYCGGGDGRGMR
jgi:hypothetical protein